MRTSAGILLHRLGPGGREVLIGHMGGPFWARKDDGAWALPKGEYDDSEEALAAAQREFTEETGFVAAEEDVDQPEVVTFDRMSEEELLAGIEGLVPPEKSDDY